MCLANHRLALKAYFLWVAAHSCRTNVFATYTCRLSLCEYNFVCTISTAVSL